MNNSFQSRDDSDQKYRDQLSAKKANLVCRVGEIFAQKFSVAEDLNEKMNNLAESGKTAILAAIELESEEEKKKLNESGCASLKDLVKEYEEYLRKSGLTIWDKNSEEAKDARRICRQNPDQLCRDLEEKSAEEFVNITICLVFQAISSTIKFSDEKRGGGGFPKRRNTQNRDAQGSFDRGFPKRRDDRREGAEKSGGWNDGRGGLRARKASQRGKERDGFGEGRRERNFGSRNERSFAGREGGERKFEDRGERRAPRDFGDRERRGGGDFSNRRQGEGREGFTDRKRGERSFQSRDRIPSQDREGGERNFQSREQRGEKREFGERNFEGRRERNFADRGERKDFGSRERRGEREGFGGERKWGGEKREGGRNFGDKKFGGCGGEKRRSQSGSFSRKPSREDF